MTDKWQPPDFDPTQHPRQIPATTVGWFQEIESDIADVREDITAMMVTLDDIKTMIYAVQQRLGR